jgi:hypothetical protein
MAINSRLQRLQRVWQTHVEAVIKVDLTFNILAILIYTRIIFAI